MGKKVYYKSAEEIEHMRESADLTSRTLGLLASEVQVGATPLALDKIAHDFIRDHAAEPAFLGLYGFPNTLCVSRNEQVVHGIPDKRPLENGDIVSIDCGVKKNGFCGDQAYTFAVGEVRKEVLQLLRVTQQALEMGISVISSSARIGDIGYAIQQCVLPYDYGIVRELVGHGLGRSMHEGPDVPNYGRRGNGPRLRDGLVISIEPMINLGTERIKQLEDGWTIAAADGKPSAHYEHNVAICNGKAEVLTSFAYIEAQLQPKTYV